MTVSSSHSAARVAFTHSLAPSLSSCRVGWCCVCCVVCQRLEETCKDIRSAARLIGDVQLYEKMTRASLLIKRYAQCHTHTRNRTVSKPVESEQHGGSDRAAAHRLVCSLRCCRLRCSARTATHQRHCVCCQPVRDMT